ncbi:L-ascorbate oxidase homolog isoform X1 [Papaver somniferum]|nr:L-ascorbate oxidase homolog isoform X1 [Papaver somniferum]
MYNPNCSKMRGTTMMLLLLVGVLACFGAVMVVEAEDPYRYFTWTVTYGTISPLGKPQKGILINGQFPGPRLDCVTNDNLIINVINKIDEPFLLTWNGIKNRKTIWQDGVLGSNCPILPGHNFTYHLQVKDQIGTFMYFPSLQMHKASGGYGGINMYTRPKIPLPFAEPSGDFHLLIGDWYKAGHKALQNILDYGKKLAFPDGLIINGMQNGIEIQGDPGKTYMIRVSNAGLSTSINFRIQGHKMRLVEMEGSHTVQEWYDSLDIHVGQSLAVLITLNQKAKGYYVVASSRFAIPVLTSTGLLKYSNSREKASGAKPIGPTTHVHWSLKQARSFRWNLTASAARPNPQGAYHYGSVKPTRILHLANSEVKINGKLRYAINGMSYVNPDTPLKLADYFDIPGVFDLKTFKNKTQAGPAKLGTPVVGLWLHDYVEIIFNNNENTIQSWHLSGTDGWVVGYGPKKWTAAQRKFYNLVDAATRYTIQVYPKSWTAMLVPFDNKGMWNLRSAIWPRRYLGQELYIRVWNEEKSPFTEYEIPANAILCGKARGKHI